MNEHEEAQALGKARQSRELRANPMMQEIFTVLRGTMVERISKINASKAEELQEMTRTLQNLDRLERIVDRYIDTGKLIEEKRRRFPFSKRN